MSKLPVRRDKHLPKSPGHDREVSPHRLDAVAPSATTRTGFSFRYSYTEISAMGRDASVKHAETRFENGKLTSEEFEALLDRDTHGALLGQMSDYVIRQTALAMKSLLSPNSS